MSRFASKVLMIEPLEFGYNAETGSDNTFMNDLDGSLFLPEFLKYKEKLLDLGIEVRHWKHTDPRAKDCIFANNWFITLNQPDVNVKTLVLCPMRHLTRRLERLVEFVEELKQEYTNVIDLTYFEAQNKALEGTGSLVIDRINHQFLMSVSERSSPEVLESLIGKINEISNFTWKSVVFNSRDEQGKPVYHTNVVMALTSKHAIVNVASIEEGQRDSVLASLQGYKVFEISHQDTRKFAGNVECLFSPRLNSEVLFISKKAENILQIEEQIYYVDLSCIESIGGGSSQCMMGKLF